MEIKDQNKADVSSKFTQGMETLSTPKFGCTPPKLDINLTLWWKSKSTNIEQDHLRMNLAPDRTIILGLQIFLDHRSLSSIYQKS